MKRSKIRSKKKDKVIFRKTATKTKKMNVDVPLFRGGIRL